jgi:hypothetical protein
VTRSDLPPGTCCTRTAAEAAESVLLPTAGSRSFIGFRRGTLGGFLDRLLRCALLKCVGPRQPCFSRQPPLPTYLSLLPSLPLPLKMATLATFKIPEIKNEPMVRRSPCGTPLRERDGRLTCSRHTRDTDELRSWLERAPEARGCHRRDEEPAAVRGPLCHRRQGRAFPFSLSPLVAARG